MQERHQPVAGATARTGVERPEPELSVTIQRGLDIVDAVGDVVEPAAASFQEGRDLRGGTRRSEQLHAGLADLEHDRLDAVRLDHLAMARGATQELPVGRNGGVDVIHRDPDVVDPAQHRGEYRNDCGAERSPSRCTGAMGGRRFDATFGSPMSRPRLPAAVIAAVAALLLAGYATLWSGVSPTDVSRSDFTSFYVGGTLLREGQGAAIYDPALQAALHASLTAPLPGGNLPFVNPPAAALVFAPITLLPLAAAYRTWQAIQLLMLVAALLIAARFAPWPARLRRGGIAGATVLAALAGTGTLALGLLGQWDGLSALGLAAAYALWRRDRPFSGGAVLAGCVLLAKPHLAFGLAALVLAWRDRRVLAGAVCAVAVLGVVSLATVGPAGIDSFIASVRDDAGRWPLASMLGFTGLTGSWLGDGAVATVIAAAGSVAALAGCVVVGRRLARDRQALEPCVALAMALSLLASPHLLAQDLVLLGPVVVALMAWTSGRDGTVPWPGPYSRAVLAGWALLAMAAALDLGEQGVGPPGRLVPWALLGLAGVVAWQLRPPRPRTMATAPT
jgi:hypothetical protein